MVVAVSLGGLPRKPRVTLWIKTCNPRNCVSQRPGGLNGRILPVCTQEPTASVGLPGLWGTCFLDLETEADIA